MYRTLTSLLAITISAQLFAQNDITAKPLKQDAVPKQAKFRGKLKEGWQWNDKNGENILLLSSLDPYHRNGAAEDEQTAELFAVHYVKKDTSYKALWRLNDLVKDCPLDMVLEFLKDATIITDLDKDGIAETTIQYKYSCRGDVSPSSMKLIMHEDSLKYALRGVMWMDGAAPEAKFDITEKNANFEKLAKPKDDWEMYLKSFGRYESEKDFLKAPPTFITHARKRWVLFARETD